MNGLERLSAQIPAAYEVLRWAGLQRRRTRITRAVNRAGMLGAGLALGAGAAILLAPRSGAETRKKLSRKAEQARQYVNSVAPNAEEAHDARQTNSNKHSTESVHAQAPNH